MGIFFQLYSSIVDFLGLKVWTFLSQLGFRALNFSPCKRNMKMIVKQSTKMWESRIQIKRFKK